MSKLKKISDFVKNRSLSRMSLKIEVKKPIHFIEYVQQKTQRERDMMWAEFLAANRQGVPVVIINPHSTRKHVNYVRRVCNGIKLHRDVALISFTSGSTGSPKPIQKTNASFTYKESFSEFKGCSVVADFVNPNHAFSFLSFVGASMVGAKFVYINNSLDYQSIVKELIKKRVDYLAAVSAYWDRICRVLEKNKIRIDLKIARISGRVDDSIIRTLSKYSNCKIYVSYGSSETGTCSLLKPDKVLAKPNSVGKPLPAYKVKIIKPNGREGGAFEVGEIVVQSKLVSPSCPNPFKTGDMGYKDKDGDLFILGRRDNRLKIGGYRVNTEQLEAAYNKYSACIFGIPSKEPGNHEAVAVFETAEPLEKIKKYVASVEPPISVFCRPKYIFKTKKFPRLLSGKIDVHEIKRIFGSRIKAVKNKISSSKKGEAPETKTEKIIAKIWQQILNKRKIGINENFFYLGGDSLKSMQLASKINGEFGIVFPIIEVFRNPTIKKMGKKIEEYLNKKNN